jgi:hypothetical protein
VVSLGQPARWGSGLGALRELSGGEALQEPALPCVP